MKKRIWRKKAAALLLAVTAVSNHYTAYASQLDTFTIQTKMEFIQAIIDKYYLFEEDMEKVEDGIYSGMVSGLGDPYSVYFNEQDFQQLQESTQGEYHGIGLIVSQDKTTGLVSVVGAYENTPAYRADFQPGDIIYKVDGQDVTGVDIQLLAGKYLKGDAGTSFVLTVYRPSTKQYLDFSLQREKIEIPTETHSMIEDQIGYIRVYSFEMNTAAQFQQAIEQLQKEGMEQLIIDLRDNLGGVLDSALKMLAYILPDGQLVYTADKNGTGTMYQTEDGYIVSQPYPVSASNRKTVFAPDNHSLDIPIVILVNEQSASASEVFTGAMKDYQKATVIGTNTFGKGIVQYVIPLGDGTAVKLTGAHYYTPSGFDLHGKGLQPDIEVDLEEDLKTKLKVTMQEDNQLQEAIKFLKQAK